MAKQNVYVEVEFAEAGRKKISVIVNFNLSEKSKQIFIIKLVVKRENVGSAGGNVD